MCTITDDLHNAQPLNGAIWCDLKKYPEWNVLPFSAFDRQHCCPDKMLEFQTCLSYSGKGSFLLRFTAGCRFRMLINGIFAEDGPIEIGGDYGKENAPNWWFYDEKDIAPFLQAGKNELIFQMIPAGMTQMDYSIGFGWLWCAVIKNKKWQPIPCGKWRFRINPFYCRKDFQNFLSQETKWTKECQTVQVPLQAQWLGLPSLVSVPHTDFRFLFPFGKRSNIKLTGKRIQIHSGDPVTFFLEFPEERCGHFELKWEGSHDAVLQLEFQELYGVPQGMEEWMQLSVQPGSCRTIRIYAFRYVRITVTPSCFTSENCRSALLLSFKMYERHFPFRKKYSIAQISNRLQQIDKLCIRNLIMCMQRMHLDSPIHQEGLGCTGDYRIEALAEYAVFHESRLARADLIRTAFLLRQQGKLFHTSYELCYILMFWEYVLFTGDKALLAECYDVLCRIYRRFHSFTGPTGLISEAENYLFIDWIVDGKYNFHHPPASRGTGVMTALWYGALQALTQIAEYLNKSTDRIKYQKESAQVRLAFNQELWDPELSCYCDGIPGLSRRKPNAWLPEEDGIKTHSSLTSIMALAYGLPTAGQAPEKLLQKIMEGKLPLRPTVYYMFYLFEAVKRYGKWEKYKSWLLSQWIVFLQTGLRESWTAGDYSHGWGVSPSIFLRLK